MKKPAIFLLLGLPVLSGLLVSGETPSFFGIKPGATTRAEVELMLGEPVALADGEARLFEYPPPSGANDASKVVIGFFDDTKEVSRLDVCLRVPLEVEPLRQEFGRAAFTRERADGGKEEFYYPRFQGIVFSSGPDGDRALAIVFLSPRYLASLFVARARACLAKKDYEQARLEAEKAVLADPDDAEGYNAQARYLYARKEYDQALGPLLKAMNAKHSAAALAEAHTLAGVIQKNHKNSPETAAREFAQAVAISDSYAPAHFQLGLLLQSQQKYDPAMKEFVRTLELDPKHTSAKVKLADYHYDRKAYREALGHYEALSVWAESEAAAGADTGLRSQIHFRHGYCLMQEINELAPDYSRPIAEFRRAVELNPQEEIYHSNFGHAYEKAENWAEAERCYLKSLALVPGALFSNEHLGIALLEQGRAQAALEQAEKTLALEPRNPNLMMDIARCCAALKKKGQAKEWIRKAGLAGYEAREGAWDLDPFFQTVFKIGEIDKLLVKKP